MKILKGEAEPKDMPIEYQENADLIINEDTAKELGITIPDNLKKEAKMVTTQKRIYPAMEHSLWEDVSAQYLLQEESIRF